MPRRATWLATVVCPSVCTVAMVLSACGPVPKRTDEPTHAPTSSSPTNDVTEDESGPESPIAYGFKVPIGASQIGPLVRFRSERLIEAYLPELQAAEARADADKMRVRDNKEASGTPPPPPTPTPTATEPPTDDTFRVLKAPPKPDTTISVMRINGQPTAVVRAMLAQMDVIVPKARVVRSDLTKYCDSKWKRVLHCHLSVSGRTPTGRDIVATLDVDPGDFRTRTSAPASDQRPVMILKVEYDGDPRAGQENRRGDSDVSVPSRVTLRDRSGFIWPKMDLDGKRSSKLLNGWRAPRNAKLLLSGYNPGFVVVSTTRALDASTIARKYAVKINPDVQPDVVEDLNEITTTYRAADAEGGQALASYVLSARGYYAVLFYSPPEAPATPAPTTTTVAAAPLTR